MITLIILKNVAEFVRLLFPLASASMKQIEVTSKLVVALIVLVVFSAMTVPSVVAQSTSSPPIRANSVTSGSIKDGEVKTNDLADNAVTSPKIADGTIQEEDIAAGVIPSGAAQPFLHVVVKTVTVGPDSIGNGDAVCLDGELATGGGAARNTNVPLQIIDSFPLTKFTWSASVYNPHPSETFTFNVYAVCMDFSP